MGFFSMGMGEMVVIAIVAVVLFGGKLPEVARTFGGYYQQFRNGLSDIQTSIKNDLDMQDSLNAPPRIADHSDIDDEEPAPSFEPPPEEDE